MYISIYIYCIIFKKMSVYVIFENLKYFKTEFEIKVRCPYYSPGATRNFYIYITEKIRGK